MGGVLAVSPDAVWGNPAGAVLPAAEAGAGPDGRTPNRPHRGRLAAAAARPFDLPELSESQVAVFVAGADAAAGAGARRFGSQVYAEKEVRLTGSWSPTSTLALGAAARGLSAGGVFAPYRSFALDAAFLARPDAGTAVGALVEGILGEVPGDPRGDRRRTAFGLARRLGARAVLRVELQRQGGGPLAAAMGASWDPWPILTLRAGAREDPRTLSWGFTVRRGPLAVSGSAAHAHPLGRTLRIGVGLAR
jgi:hypothetical protein